MDDKPIREAIDLIEQDIKKKQDAVSVLRELIESAADEPDKPDKPQKPEATPRQKKPGKTRYFASQKEVAAILHDARLPLTNFAIQQKLFEAGIKITDDVLSVLLKNGKGKLFDSPEDGKWIEIAR